jgi:hypothetical protein
MVFTRILTLAELPTGTYYLYLALYNDVCVVPLVLIVAAFVVTLGARKLQKRGGQPPRGALLVTGLAVAWDRRRAREHSRAPG